MDPYTTAEIKESRSLQPVHPKWRGFGRCLAAMIIGLTLLAGNAVAGTDKDENVITLGIMQAPLVQPPAAGVYVRLLISLEVPEDIDHREVTKHLVRLRDEVMQDLYKNPIPPNRKNNEIDVAAIEARLLNKVSHIVGSRYIERVRVYEVTKNRVCDKDAPVGAWSHGCLPH